MEMIRNKRIPCPYLLWTPHHFFVKRCSVRHFSHLFFRRILFYSLFLSIYISVVVVIVVAFTYTYPISLFHHLCCRIESRSLQDVLDTTVCDKVSQWFVTGQRFSPGTPVSSTNRTDCHDITEILINTITLILTITLTRILLSSTMFVLFKSKTTGVTSEGEIVFPSGETGLISVFMGCCWTMYICQCGVL